MLGEKCGCSRQASHSRKRLTAPRSFSPNAVFTVVIKKAPIHLMRNFEHGAGFGFRSAKERRSEQRSVSGKGQSCFRLRTVR